MFKKTIEFNTNKNTKYIKLIFQTYQRNQNTNFSIFNLNISRNNFISNYNFDTDNESNNNLIINKKIFTDTEFSNESDTDINNINYELKNINKQINQIKNKKNSKIYDLIKEKNSATGTSESETDIAIVNKELKNIDKEIEKIKKNKQVKQNIIKTENIQTKNRNKNVFNDVNKIKNNTSLINTNLSNLALEIKKDELVNFLPNCNNLYTNNRIKFKIDINNSNFKTNLLIIKFNNDNNPNINMTIHTKNKKNIIKDKLIKYFNNSYYHIYLFKIESVFHKKLYIQINLDDINEKLNISQFKILGFSNNYISINKSFSINDINYNINDKKWILLKKRYRNNKNDTTSSDSNDNKNLEIKTSTKNKISKIENKHTIDENTTKFINLQNKFNDLEKKFNNELKKKESNLKFNFDIEKNKEPFEYKQLSQNKTNNLSFNHRELFSKSSYSLLLEKHNTFDLIVFIKEFLIKFSCFSFGNDYDEIKKLQNKINDIELNDFQNFLNKHDTISECLNYIEKLDEIKSMSQKLKFISSELLIQNNKIINQNKINEELDINQIQMDINNKIQIMNNLINTFIYKNSNVLNNEKNTLVPYTYQYTLSKDDYKDNFTIFGVNLEKVLYSNENVENFGLVPYIETVENKDENKLSIIRNLNVISKNNRENCRNIIKNGSYRLQKIIDVYSNETTKIEYLIKFMNEKLENLKNKFEEKKIICQNNILKYLSNLEKKYEFINLCINSKN